MATSVPVSSTQSTKPVNTSQADNARTTEQSGARNGAAEDENNGESRLPVKPVANRNVYYSGTEELKPDEMRVVCCGSELPMPRLKQAAGCFLVELGNGDKFIFDMGTGSLERLYVLGIPLDYIDKVFLTHLHMDHMGDLPRYVSATGASGNITYTTVCITVPHNHSGGNWK